MSIFLFVLRISWVYAYAKSCYQNLNFNYEQFIVCQCYLNKVVLKVAS